MKRALTLTTAMLLATASLGVGVASAQEGGDPETTTTTKVDDTTTTEVKETTTTTVAEETTTTVAEETTTTVAGETTTTEVAPPTTEVPAPLDLPGMSITSGMLRWEVNFSDDPDSSCVGETSSVGKSLNVGFDDAGNVGGLYGLVPASGGTVGVFMIGLGAIPAGVAIVSVSNDVCEFDAIGIGSYTSDGSSASLDGVGVGVHPGAYDTGDFAKDFNVSTDFTAVASPPFLDMEAVQTFLLRDRPGLVLPGGEDVPAEEIPAGEGDEVVPQ